MKTQKIDADKLKKGQFFRRGQKKAVWQRDDCSLRIYCQQITGRNVGKCERLKTFEQITPVKVEITVTS